MKKQARNGRRSSKTSIADASVKVGLAGLAKHAIELAEALAPSGTVGAILLWVG